MRRTRSDGLTKAIWILVCCISFAACKKDPPAPTQAPPPKAAGVSIDAQDAAPPPPPTAQAAAALEPTTANAAAPSGDPPPPTQGSNPTDYDFSAGNNLKGGELATPEVLAAYNKRLARVNYQISDFPQKLEDLNKWPMMPPLPKAPPGRRIVYDLRSRSINVE